MIKRLQRTEGRNVIQSHLHNGKGIPFDLEANILEVDMCTYCHLAVNTKA